MSLSPLALQMFWLAHRQIRRSRLLADHAALMAALERKEDDQHDSNPDKVSRSKEVTS